jgi:hypothetical protein
MVFTAYVCSDFEMSESGVMTIWGSIAEFSSNNREVVEKFIANSFENAVVCPVLYFDELGRTPSGVIFK